ncbi:hypothetical protein JCM10450v2_004584 [Rhodotorula kratochvilovae]
MLDQLAGRPSPSWRRSQVWLVLLFWLSRIAFGPAEPPNVPFLRRLHRAIQRRCSPWQVVLSTLTLLYAVRHGDVLLGLQAPEPLARLYSRDYYRATWIATALDAGFATAMSIRWKWLRDLASLAFSGYYLVFANEADEKLRKFRAFCTVEMLRVTWEKQTNPYIKFATAKDRPFVPTQRKVFLPRPKGSRYSKPITVLIFYAGTDAELASAHELVMDVPGGGFICMTPEHHAERLLRWARQLGPGKVVVSFDYGKAPEYPFPFAIDEMYDAYSLLHESKGKCVGMNTAGAKDLKVVLTGDSAGANIATAMIIKLLEESPSPKSSPSSRTASAPAPPSLPLPTALVFAYPALSFHFTSWMPAQDLRVLRSESHPDVANLLRQKDHLEHRSPLAVVEDVERRSASSERGRPKVLRRRRTTSWGRGLVRNLPGSASFAAIREGYFLSGSRSGSGERDGADEGAGAGSTLRKEEDDEEVPVTDEGEKSLSERVLWWDGANGGGARGGAEQRAQKALEGRVREDQGKKEEELEGKGEGKGKSALAGTRLAMTSRTAFFNDRIISPPMLRAMALLYIGPRNAPDLHSDYHISPIFTPAHMLARFPPVYMSCGERDPLVDDTVIFAGKLREAKEARKQELLARESRHGDGLRMSSSSSKRDPLLDEDEDDWVQTSIIAGWSHGYLQMVSLLPAAEKVISMHADWIAEAFDRTRDKDEQCKSAAPPSPSQRAPSRLPQLQQQRSPTPSPRKLAPVKPINIVPPTPTLEQGPTSPIAMQSPATPPKGTDGDDSREDDDVLTFTPRRRRGSSNTSRTVSPAPLPLPAKAMPSVDAIFGSGDAGRSRTPSNGSTGPQIAAPAPTHAHVPSHLITPVERALRADLHASLKHNGHGAPRAQSATPRSAMGRADASAGRALSPPAPRGGSPHGVKGRSNSSGSLPAAQGAVFIDAKELLRRRRDDVVSGISLNNSRNASRSGSDGEREDGAGDEGDERAGARVARRRTMED